ncbi:MAG: type II 3-dehydroquinate dehydratase, partial [Bacteroidota bacterium]
SFALADAIAAIETPVVEVHISNTFSREEFRHKSLVAPNCVGSIIGLGLKGYDLAVEYFMS